MKLKLTGGTRICTDPDWCYVQFNIWSAWKVSTNGKGWDIVPGGWIRVLEHLLKCKDCRKRNGRTYRDVRAELREVLKMYQEELEIMRWHWERG